jgi:hypothetical protein
MTILDERPEFSLAYWRCWAFMCDGEPKAVLVMNPPVESPIREEVQPILDAIRSELAKLPKLANVTCEPIVYEAAHPWEHGGWAKLTFDPQHWTVHGYAVRSNVTRWKLNGQSEPDPALAKLDKWPGLNLCCWFAFREGADVSEVVIREHQALDCVDSITLLPRPVITPNGL